MKERQADCSRFCHKVRQDVCTHLPTRGLEIRFKMVLLCCQGNVKGGEEKVHFFLYYLLALPSSLNPIRRCP